jgi:hypothetical protein
MPLCLFFLMGCGTGPLVGVIYTKVKMPLSRDLNVSPVKNVDGTGKVLKIREPLSGYGIYAEINSNAIGEIAQKHGIETVYFADQEFFSVLGIWTATKVILYGEKNSSSRNQNFEN